MSGLGGEKLRSKISRVFFVVCVAALAGLAVLELGVGWEKALVVGWSAEGFLASRLGAVRS